VRLERLSVSVVGSSADGGLANARAMTEEQVLAELGAWAK
jgi:hypothetical protein